MMREKRIETMLSQYVYIDNKIKMLELKLEREKMSGSPRDISAVDFGKVGHGTGGSKSAQVILSNVQIIINQINELKIEKETIERFLEIIKGDSKEQYDFIKYYYFEKRPTNEILDKLGYSYNSRAKIYQLKNDIIEKYENIMLS